MKDIETHTRIFVDHGPDESFENYKLDIDPIEFGGVIPSVGDHIISPFTNGAVWEVTHRYFRPESDVQEQGYVYVALVVKMRPPKHIEVDLDYRLAKEYFGE